MNFFFYHSRLTMWLQAYPQQPEGGNPQTPTCDDRRENNLATCKITHAKNSASPCLVPSTSESHVCTTKQIAAHVPQNLRTGSTTPSEDLGTSPIVPCAKTNGASGRTHTGVCPNPPLPSPTHCSATKNRRRQLGLLRLPRLSTQSLHA